MNLFGELKELFAGDIPLKIANITGETEAKVKVAIDGLIPTLIGGLMKRVSNEAGATTLMNVIQRGKHDGSINDRLDDYLRDKESFAPLFEQGSSVISLLLPDKKSSVATLISQYASIRNSSATLIMAGVAPIIVGKLGKLVISQGLDKIHLANYLLEQKAYLIDETPEALQPKMIDTLGIAVFMSQEIKPIQFAPAAPIKSVSVNNPVAAKPMAEQKVTYSGKNYESEASESMKIPKWFLPSILIVAVIAGLGYFAFTYDWKSLSSSSTAITDSSDMEEVTGAVIDTNSLSKDTTVAKVDTANTINETKTIGVNLPNGQKVDLTDGSFTYNFARYLSDSVAAPNRIFTFDHIGFEGNTAALTAGSDKTVNDLAKIILAYPRVQIKLTAFTDNTGDSLQNIRLTARRAVAIRNILIGNGIKDTRIDFVGRGSRNPIASNATEEGKAKNRRIELKVVKK
ncbi:MULTISPECIES: OmpA family protein [unclassified Arcicella]|uniref:OmpA family protein n=1 Tax=unclassified Arcicella TaxID=2644986 RepID=UPI0028648F7C|nr:MULTISPECIES: OmpA family protein [unclassified Arcicella]MDR6562892.1 outer membrane protein OmpA-like peptidoglycan-associated protein [Arcicella sp. BE51]MDR6812767.1 outer membrane protein OmpA-like peptidoglycan-associated protein [Arcicella sp. BE140]MDR6824079.1 outer membrane protein OmpA-like peptidoglycan-associated protein [Arcicella sp. BE139]